MAMRRCGLNLPQRCQGTGDNWCLSTPTDTESDAWLTRVCALIARPVSVCGERQETRVWWFARLHTRFVGDPDRIRCQWGPAGVAHSTFEGFGRGLSSLPSNECEWMIKMNQWNEWRENLDKTESVDHTESTKSTDVAQNVHEVRILQKVQNP